MKTTKYIHILTAALALGLTACSDNNDTQETPDNQEIRLGFSINASTEIAGTPTTKSIASTRANTTSTPMTDARVGVFFAAANAATLSGITGNSANNLYQVDKDGSTSTAKPVYWNDYKTALDIYAYSPYDTTAPLTGDGDAIEWSVKADQSGGLDTDLVISNNMRGLTYTANKAGTAELVFGHALAQLRINLKDTGADADSYTTEELAAATATLSKLYTEAEISFVKTTDGAKTVTTTGSQASGLKPYKTPIAAGTGNAATFEAIVVPQKIKAGTVLGTISVTKTIDGNEQTQQYTVSPDQDYDLMQGYINTINVSINKTGVVLSMQLEDWQEQTITLTPISLDGITATSENAANIDALDLWETGKFGNKAAYTWDANNNKWNSSKPFYLENLASGATFYARHTPMQAANTPKTDPVSHLGDILGNTTAGTLSSVGGLSLKLKHLLARLDITLVKGNGYPTDISLNGATITLKGFKSGYTLSDTNVATANGSDTEYNLTNTNGTGASIIVAPQTLPIGTEITVQLKEGAIAASTYIFKATSPIDLQAGSINKLTLTLNLSEPAISVAVAEWSTGADATGSLTIDGINGGGSTGNIMPNKGDKLAITYRGEGTNTAATYSYNGSAWTSNAPFYWEYVTKGNGTNFPFTAIYTPAANGTPEKDLYYGLATPAFGAPLNFEMKHAMAQVKIELKAGEGYAKIPDNPTEEENKAMIALLATRTLNLKRLSSFSVGYSSASTPAATPNVTLNSIVENVLGNKNFDAGTTYLVAPQSVSDDNATIVLKLNNGNSYTKKLKDITVTTGGSGSGTSTLSDLEGGKSYTLTLTVNETAISFGCTIEDWTNISGSGDLEPDWKL